MLWIVFLDTDTIHTVAKMTANLKGSNMSVLPSSMPVLQTADGEVCLTVVCREYGAFVVRCFAELGIR